MRLRVDGRVAGHRRVVHGGPFSAASDGAVLDFSSNVNPLGVPEAARALWYGSLEAYPDPDSTELRMALQEYTGVSHRRILAGNGATEIIYNFCRAFILEGMPVLIPIPTFGEYEAACRLSGARIIRHGTMDMSQDMGDIMSRVPRNGCVFACNPNNPTGAIVPRGEMQALAEHARGMGTILFVDECFMEMVPGRDESLLPPEYDNLFVLRSMTKSFALAGARVGYGIGSAGMVSVLDEIKIPWNVSGPAQRAACAALRDPSYIQRSRRTIGEETDFLVRGISAIPGFECRRPAANFILVRTAGGSRRVQQGLLKRGILVRECSSFDGLDGEYIRVAVRSRGENRRLVEELSAL